jgi:hypothetical protein
MDSTSAFGRFHKRTSRYIYTPTGREKARWRTDNTVDGAVAEENIMESTSAFGLPAETSEPIHAHRKREETCG